VYGNIKNKVRIKRSSTVFRDVCSLIQIVDEVDKKGDDKGEMILRHRKDR
jgi:hypothetical protein